MSDEENKMENKKDDNNEDEDKNIIIFNVITLGDSGVGKTSIIKRYVYNKFELDNISTIGINFAFKKIKLKNNQKVKIKLIDTAGQEKYRSLNKTYFKNAEAVLYVFSHDKENSLENIKIWKKLFNENNILKNIPEYLIRNKIDLLEEDNLEEEEKSKIEEKYSEESLKDFINENNTIKDIPGYLIRNKIDLLEEDNLQEEEKSKIKERYSEESLKDFIKEYKFLNYFSTSAKDEKNNLDEIFETIAEKCYQKYGKIKKQNNFTIKDEKKGGSIFNKCELCRKDLY